MFVFHWLNFDAWVIIILITTIWYGLR